MATRGFTLAAIVTVVMAALIAWAIPITSVVLIWPILFFAPGWIVIRRVVPDLPTPGAVGGAIVTSVYVSAHLVDVVARVTGFGRESVIVSAAGLAFASIAVARSHHRWLEPLPRPTLRSIMSALRADASAWIVAISASLAVLVVLMVNGWVATPDGWVAGGWNWSDLLVHVAIGSSIAAGNFPPDVPYFAGEPLTYHWFADFHGAITSTVAGVDLIGTYFATSALFAGVLALVVWALALRLTGRQRVATIAAILVCFGGGLGWIRLVGDVIAGMGGVVHLVSRTSYDNTWADGWPFFKVASIFGTGFLPHRATTLGLPGLVTVVLVVVASVGKRPLGMLLAGVLAALLAPFQFFAFPATYLIVGLYVLTSGAWRERSVWRDAVLFLAPIVLAAPFILAAIGRQSDIGSFRFVLGWSEARMDDGPAAVAFFYLTNLGIPFVAGGRRRVDGPRPAPTLVPGRLDGRPVRRAQHRRGQRGRVRHEQVLPDHVDRRGHPGGLADPSMAKLGDRPRDRSVGAVAGPDRRMAPALARRRVDAAPGSGRQMDRGEHARAVRLRHRRFHQQPG